MPDWLKITCESCGPEDLSISISPAQGVAFVCAKCKRTAICDADSIALELAGSSLAQELHEGVHEGMAPETIRDGYKGLIYFVTGARAGHPIKIGFTQRSVASRIVDLQVGNPERLHALAVIEDYQDLERSLHRAFGRSRLAGEWFERTPALMAFIDEAGEPMALA